MGICKRVYEKHFGLQEIRWSLNATGSNRRLYCQLFIKERYNLKERPFYLWFLDLSLGLLSVPPDQEAYSGTSADVGGSRPTFGKVKTRNQNNIFCLRDSRIS